jgi:transposase
VPTGHPATAPRVAVRASDAAPFASLGLGEARRLATASAPGGGKPSRHAVAGGAGGAPPDLPARPGTTAERRAGLPVRVVVLREAGPDGSRVRRPPGADGTGSRVVDPAPTAADRRHRRAGTGTTGGGKLVRTLTARARGEWRVSSTVRPPSPGEEDRRRPTRGRGTLPEGRTRHTDRIEGPPAGRGAADHGPPRKDRPTRLDAPGTGGGRPSPERLEAGIRREIGRAERVASPTAPVERGRDALVGTASGGEPAAAAGDDSQAAVARLYRVGERTLSGWLEVAREEGRRSPKPRRGGRPPIGGEREALAGLVAERNDAALAEYAGLLAERAGVRRSASALCRALTALGLARKKRRSRLSSGTARTSPRRGGRGGTSWPRSTRPAWSSSTRPGSIPG